MFHYYLQWVAPNLYYNATGSTLKILVDAKRRMFSTWFWCLGTAILQTIILLMPESQKGNASTRLEMLSQLSCQIVNKVIHWHAFCFHPSLDYHDSRQIYNWKIWQMLGENFDIIGKRRYTPFEIKRGGNECVLIFFGWGTMSGWEAMDAGGKQRKSLGLSGLTLLLPKSGVSINRV